MIRMHSYTVQHGPCRVSIVKGFYVPNPRAILKGLDKRAWHKCTHTHKQTYSKFGGWLPKRIKSRVPSILRALSKNIPIQRQVCNSNDNEHVISFAKSWSKMEI